MICASVICSRPKTLLWLIAPWMLFVFDGKPVELQTYGCHQEGKGFIQTFSFYHFPLSSMVQSLASQSSTSSPLASPPSPICNHFGYILVLLSGFIFRECHFFSSLYTFVLSELLKHGFCIHGGIICFYILHWLSNLWSSAREERLHCALAL